MSEQGSFSRAAGGADQRDPVLVGAHQGVDGGRIPAGEQGVAQLRLDVRDVRVTGAVVELARVPQQVVQLRLRVVPAGQTEFPAAAAQHGPRPVGAVRGVLGERLVRPGADRLGRAVDQAGEAAAVQIQPRLGGRGGVHQRGGDVDQGGARGDPLACHAAPRPATCSGTRADCS